MCSVLIIGVVLLPDTSIEVKEVSATTLGMLYLDFGMVTDRTELQCSVSRSRLHQL